MVKWETVKKESVMTEKGISIDVVKIKSEQGFEMIALNKNFKSVAWQKDLTDEIIQAIKKVNEK